MKELLNDIEKGIEFRKNRKPTASYEYQGKINYYIQDTQGLGSKAYIIKRIDLLREKLLEVKKELK